MEKLTKEDIILFFLEDPYKLATEIWKGSVPKSDEIRTLICELGNARCAYWYALQIDKKPTDEIRTLICELGNPWCAYCYARDIDKGPTDETRTASCRGSDGAYWYARYIDKKPTDETREAANKAPYYKQEYEEWEKECSLKKI